MRNEIVCSESEVWGFLNSLGATNLIRTGIQMQKNEFVHESGKGGRSTPWSTCSTLVDALADLGPGWEFSRPARVCDLNFETLNLNSGWFLF